MILVKSALFVVLSLLTWPPQGAPSSTFMAEFFDGGYISPIYFLGCTSYTPGAQLSCGAYAEVTAGQDPCDIALHAHITGSDGLSATMRVKVIPPSTMSSMAASTYYQSTNSGTWAIGKVWLDCFNPVEGDIQVNGSEAYWWVINNS
jgi:hypothetical protein